MNEIRKLDKLLFNCLEKTLKNFHFDFQKNKISLTLAIDEEDNNSEIKITFFNVSSYYFLNNEGSNRLIFIEPDRIWMNSFYYIKEGIGKINILSNEEWATNFYSGANFILEICGTSLFIEAEAIQINDQYFHVGYSKIDKDIEQNNRLFNEQLFREK